MCTLLLAILKDVAVFVWFWQDLMLEEALPVCGRMWLHAAFDVEKAKWHFWCQQMPPWGTATNCTAFAVDVPRRKLWRRTSDLTKSLWAFFLWSSLLSFQGDFMVVREITYHLKENFWKWHLYWVFGFWIFFFDLVNLKALCGASGGQKGFWFLTLWPNKLYVAS